MLVWRKSDNSTAFTDGYRTWVNGPQGVQSRLNDDRFPWEADVYTSFLPKPPQGWTWLYRSHYESVRNSLFEAEQEWEKALGFQEWAKDRDGDVIRHVLIEKALGKSVGGVVSALVDAALNFARGSRDDTKRNLQLFREQRQRLEAAWNNPANHRGSWVLVPSGDAEVPVVSFPNWWHIWSDWLPF